MGNNRLKTYLIICITVFIFIGMVGYYAYVDYEDKTLLNTKKNLISSAQKNEIIVKNMIQSTYTLVENVGTVLYFSDMDDPRGLDMELNGAANRMFNDMIKQVPLISSVYFVSDETGSAMNRKGIYSIDDMGADLRERLWYERAANAQIPIITEMYEDRNTKKPVITISYGVKKDGKLKGVVAADIFIDKIFETFEGITKMDEIEHFILDSRGNVILHPLKELLGFSMAKPQKHFLNEFTNNNKILEGYKEIWDEGISQNYEGDIDYINISNKRKYGHFQRINGLEWIIVSRIDYDYINNELIEYLIRISIFGTFIWVLIALTLYYMMDRTYDRDDLTGLYGRKRLLEVLDKRKRTDQDQIILYMALKNLSEINETYGTKMGDRVLKEFSILLRNRLKKEDLLVRSKEESFLCLCHTNDWDNALEMAHSLYRDMEDYHLFHGEEWIHGIVFFGLIKLKAMDDWGQSIFLMEEIFGGFKNKSETQMLSFDNIEYLLKVKEEKDRIKNELLKAMKEDRVVPFFQPIKRLKEEKINKYEVLMRIQRDEEYLSPFPYIQAAEENNLIGKLDLMVIRKALAYKREVDKEDEISLSINISGKMLDDGKFLSEIVALIMEYNIKYENITFEITETQSIGNMDSFIDMIGNFRRMGFTFSIDDFGTGFSSMYYLKRIPADYVKIDGSFIRDMDEKKENFYLVQSIVNMAKAFNMKTIAEYVESEKILNKIKEIEIEYGQGYYIGRPNRFFQFHDKL